jgi:hypothetical protein
MSYSTTNPPFFEESSLSNPIPSPYVAHQLYDPYGIHLALDPALQTQPQDGQFMFGSFDPSPAFGVHKHHDAETGNYTQTTPAIPMGPPIRSRKSKAPTLRANAWEPYKAQIVELHITQGLPLKEVREHIQREFGFTAEYVTLSRSSRSDF